MAYYPRVFYENGDDSGGSGAGQAAAEIASSVAEQKKLTEAFEATKKQRRKRRLPGSLVTNN